MSGVILNGVIGLASLGIGYAVAYWECRIRGR